MEEAAGSAINYNLLYKILELFPDACPNYLRQVCSGKDFSDVDVNETIEEILTTPNYPKRQQQPPSPELELNIKQQSSLIKSILPDMDPIYVNLLTNRYSNATSKLRAHIANLLDTQEYPRKKNKPPAANKIRQKILAQQLQYTDKFSVENFLKLFPDPDAHFNDPERKPSIAADITKDHSSYLYAMHYLKNTYNCLPQRTINFEFRDNNYSVVKTAGALEKLAKSSKANSHGAIRRITAYYKRSENIPLLQEIAYVKHRDEIKAYIKKRNRNLKRERDAARRNGLMKTCGCCFDEEVMPDETVFCERKCVFCKGCLRKSVEVGFAEGRTRFGCLDNCESCFSLETIQGTVAPKLFSKLLQKLQHEEVQAAGIEGLATCPFCNFAIIMDPNYKILQCLNTECMKETCRLCKEPSHIPLRCDEVEKDDDVSARTYIESKMTEALLRKCYQCGMNFIKSEGCNKITCSCGAKMCYICKIPVADYSHFNGPGGSEFEKCPLFSDTHELHENAILRVVKIAKAEIETKFRTTKLKHDPSIDIEEHYGKLRRENAQHLPAGV